MGFGDFLSSAAEMGSYVGSYMKRFSKEQKKIKEGKAYNEGLDADTLMKIKQKEQEAITNQDALAMWKIGNAYLGISQDIVGYDPDKAIEWWERAAELGNVNAQFNLGYLYHVNLVYEDAELAGFWLDAAADRGSREARKILSEYYQYSKLRKKWTRIKE